MSDSQYTIALPLGITTHYQDAVLLFMDRTAPENPELDARVRSGDYFITLATEIETIAEDLPSMNIAACSVALSRLAKDLDYIQRHYEIVKKAKADELTELH